MRRRADDTTPSPEDRLKASLEHASKNGYWKPPHNLLVNFALMGANLWHFTILPLFWKNRGYRQDLKGIVIHPQWNPVQKDVTLGVRDSSGFVHMTDKVVDALLKGIQTLPTIETTTRGDLHQLETHFKITIPDAIKSKIVRESLKVAKRRWGVNQLKVRDRLIPLDGSKPRDLGAFD